jgi:hypothetical protein
MVGFLDEKLPKKIVEDRLRKFGVGIEDNTRNQVINLEYEGKKSKTPVSYTQRFYPEHSVDRISKILPELGFNMKPQQIYKMLSEPPSFSVARRVMEPFMVVFSFVLVASVLVRTKLITGASVSNIPNTTSNIIIILCICGLLGLGYFIYIKKKKHPVRK